MKLSVQNIDIEYHGTLNLWFKITINIKNSYNHTNTARWPYRIIRLHKYTQVKYLSFGKSLVILNMKTKCEYTFNLICS